MYVKILRPTESALKSVTFLQCIAAHWSWSKNDDGSLTVSIGKPDGTDDHAIVRLDDEAYLLNEAGDTISRIRYEYKADITG